MERRTTEGRKERGTGEQGTVFGGITPYRPCGTYKEGTLIGVRITSTLIKRLYYKGEPREFLCPKKEYHHILLGDRVVPPTENMKRGLLFEAIIAGDHETEYAVERSLRLQNGRQSVHTVRIYEQAERFDIIAHKYGIKLDKYQVKYHGGLEIKHFEHINFELEGTGDLETPIESPMFSHNNALIDIKLTMDRNSEFSEFSWGAPQYMDHTQLVLYSYLSGLPAAYMVFDYKSRDRGHKIIPVATMAMFPDGQPDDLARQQHYNAAKDRFVALKVAIKDTAHTVLKWDAEGYPAEPSFEACKSCPMNPQNNLFIEKEQICKMASQTEIV